MKFVIDRRTWLRGEGAIPSRLLRFQDEKMCCLGFYSLACGADRRDIVDVETPFSVPGTPDWLRDEEGGLSDDCVELMTINDNKAVSETTRESRITEIFAWHGVEVVFEN